MNRTTRNDKQPANLFSSVSSARILFKRSAFTSASAMQLTEQNNQPTSFPPLAPREYLFKRSAFTSASAMQLTEQNNQPTSFPPLALREYY